MSLVKTLVSHLSGFASHLKRSVMIGVFGATHLLAQDDVVEAVQEIVPLEDLPMENLEWLKPLGRAGNESGVLYERWEELTGGEITSLRNPETLKGSASRKGLVDSLLLPRGDGMNFGVRMRGFLIAPQSGKGRLAISSDGHSELWVAPNENHFQRKLSAWVKRGAGMAPPKPGDVLWDRSQWTSEMEFEEGEKYYFEVFHRSGKGEDHLGIYWTFDGFKEHQEIPKENLLPWRGSEADQNGNGLPDDWENRVGLVLEGGPIASSWGDPDGDGLTNFEEYRDGSDPSDGGQRDGFLRWEVWDGIVGNEVATLVHNPAFRGPADRNFHIAGGQTPILKNGRFGSRLSGLVVPEVSGDYRFSVNGHYAAELWLSSDASCLKKKRIAFSPHRRDMGDWTFLPSQQSKTVTLEAGKEYYLEGLQKSSNGGWLGIAWKMEEEDKFYPLPRRVLRTPGRDKQDLNRDFLADERVNAAMLRVPERIRGITAFTQFGDPDHDGIPNWQEARDQTEIFDKTSFGGFWTREWWFLQQGDRLDLAREAGAFAQRPSMADVVEGGYVNPDPSANFYLSRLRAQLSVPADGTYRFYISGDDEAELWFAPDETKFHKSRIATVLPALTKTNHAEKWTSREDWTDRPEQRSEPYALVGEQRYFIEILHKERSGDDHVEIGWQKLQEGNTWSEITLVPASAITSYAGNWNDIDDDYLPDDWEEDQGLNPAEGGRIDRIKEGEYGDFDRDGLTNREEFLAGTNPSEADTDGDGIDDYDELKVYGSSPTVKDASPPKLVTEIDLAGGSVTAGWMFDEDGSATSMTRRGYLEYQFEIEQAGIHLVEFQGETIGFETYIPDIAVACIVNGTKVGESMISREGTRAKWLTQWLSVGSHTVRIANNNQHQNSLLKINSVKLYRQDGVDLDGNGIPDWFENYYQRGNNVLAATTRSFVSPCCLEGSAQFFDLLQINGGDLLASRGIDQNWYVNVPLSSSESTAVQVGFDGGSQGESFELIWEETDLFSLSGGPLDLRLNDSLKLGASGEPVTISLNGESMGQAFIGNPLILSFGIAGQQALTATKENGDSVTVEVRVLEVDLGETFTIAAGHPRIWELPGLPDQMILEHDSDLRLSEVFPEDEKSRCFSLRSPNAKVFEPVVLTRISPGGPIAASHGINVIDVIDIGDSSDLFIARTLEDGTKVFEASLGIVGDVPDDLSITMEFYVTDCLFENGESSIELIARDFDAEGQTMVRMYKASGHGGGTWTCHWVKPFNNDRLLPVSR